MSAHQTLLDYDLQSYDSEQYQVFPVLTAIVLYTCTTTTPRQDACTMSDDQALLDDDLLSSYTEPDFTVCCRAQEWKVHSSVISQRAKYFDVACNSGLIESTRKVIYFETFSADVVRLLLTYLYGESIPMQAPLGQAKIHSISQYFIITKLEQFKGLYEVGHFLLLPQLQSLALSAFTAWTAYALAGTKAFSHRLDMSAFLAMIEQLLVCDDEGVVDPLRDIFEAHVEADAAFLLGLPLFCKLLGKYPEQGKLLRTLFGHRIESAQLRLLAACTLVE